MIFSVAEEGSLAKINAGVALKLREIVRMRPPIFYENRIICNNVVCKVCQLTKTTN